MAKQKLLDVQLVACSHFDPPAGIEWDTDATGPEALVEFAGRACYETFDKPNPRTAENGAYIRHIMEVGHLALLEHPTATLYIRGISLSAAHELMRHRHFSFSQLSQRFVHQDQTEVIIPPLIEQDEQLKKLFIDVVDETRFAYNELLAGLEDRLSSEPNALLRKKQARQAARSILPQATETRLVVTGNFRTWRHFIGMRATEHADVEIRSLAIRCLELLRKESPAIFSDFEISTLPDGSQMATSPYVTDF